MVMLICGSVLLLTCVAFVVYEYITYRTLTKRELQTLAQVTASNITSSIAFIDKDDASEILATLKAQKNIEFACVYDKQGNLFASYPNRIKTTDLPAKLETNTYRFNGNFLEGFEPVIQENEELGTLYIRYDLKGVYNRFVLYGSIALIFLGVSFFFAFLLSRRLQGTIVNPILQLAEKARIVSDEKDYSVRAEKKSNDELGVLTDAFNHMLTQIQERNDEIKALNANLEEKIALRTNELQDANFVLQQQNDFIEMIIDSSVDLIAVFDNDFNYLVLNKQAEAIYQRDKGDIIGKNLLDVFPKLQGTPFVDNLQRAFKGEFVHQEVYPSLVSTRHFENFFIPLLNKEKAIDRVMVIGHDITSIMQANEKLRLLNTELEQSNRDLEQFAYVASHDLQEPLRKIKTFSELSEKNVQHPEILKRYLEKISSSATRMTDLIKAVLNYSRLTRSDDVIVPVNLNDILKQIVGDLELYIEEKKAVIAIEQLPIVKGVPLQLNQLFLNLMTNSLKFTNEEPRIDIKSLVIPSALVKDSSQRKETDFVQISFADNGIGFDQQYAEKVFSIFQRLHPADQYPGTGIGLALCKKIVENHGGHITVESKAGEGTTFYIYLPYDKSLQELKTEATKRLNTAME